VPARLIAPQYQEVGGEFPVPGNAGNFCPRNTEFARRTSVQIHGVQGHSVLAAKTWLQGHWVLGARMVIARREIPVAQDAIGTEAPKQSGTLGLSRRLHDRPIPVTCQPMIPIPAIPKPAMGCSLGTPRRVFPSANRNRLLPNAVQGSIDSPLHVATMHHAPQLGDNFGIAAAEDGG
jgi:hypothetical protein